MGFKELIEKILVELPKLKNQEEILYKVKQSLVLLVEIELTDAERKTLQEMQFIINSKVKQMDERKKELLAMINKVNRKVEEEEERKREQLQKLKEWRHGGLIY